MQSGRRERWEVGCILLGIFEWNIFDEIFEDKKGLSDNLFDSFGGFCHSFLGSMCC